MTKERMIEAALIILVAALAVAIMVWGQRAFEGCPGRIMC